jgi:hypothetical protein
MMRRDGKPTPQVKEPRYNRWSAVLFLDVHLHTVPLTSGRLEMVKGGHHDTGIQQLPLHPLLRFQVMQYECVTTERWITRIGSQ